MIYTGLLLLLCCFAYSYTFSSVASYGPFVQYPELEWARMEKVIGEEISRAPAPKAKFLKSGSSSGASIPEAKKVPEYRIVSASMDQKELFKPEKGARPLPNSVKEMLLVTAPPEVAATSAARPKLVEILCHIDRMYVRIRREVFKSKDAYKYLKLGTCPVNQGTKVHYYLLYLLKTDCGFKREVGKGCFLFTLNHIKVFCSILSNTTHTNVCLFQSNADYLSIRNVLSYKSTGPVVREMPFDIPLQCKFPR